MVDDQLAAPVRIVPNSGEVVGVRAAWVRGIRGDEVGFCKGGEVVGGVVVDEVAEEGVPQRVRRGGVCEKGDGAGCLGAEEEGVGREGGGGGGGGPVAEEGAEGGDLRGGEVQGGEVDGAGEGVLRDVVADAVLRVALGGDGGGEGGEERRRNVGGGCRGVVLQREPGRPGLEAGSPPGRSAGEDAVEGGRGDLHLFQALAAAGGAAGVVGVGNWSGVVRGDELFGEGDAAVHGAIAPVNDGFGGVESPRAVARGGEVASVGGHSREAVAGEMCHVGVLHA